MSKGHCINRGLVNRRLGKHAQIEPRLGKVDRQKRAAERATVVRSAKAQLAELDRRLGKGVGAIKERVKLHARLAGAE